MATPDDPVDSSTSEPAKEKLQSPHDRLLTHALQQIDAACELLSGHLPSEVTEHLKMETLQHADTSFIDLNLRRRFADRLFKVDLTADTVERHKLKANHIYIYVLIDHKSTDEPHTLVQMLGYVIRIWENLLRNGQPLVPVLPWVIYNGVAPWRVPRSLNELIPLPETWKRHVPALELLMLDVGRMRDASMVGNPVLQIALVLLKYGRSRELAGALLALFRAVSNELPANQLANCLDPLRMYVMSVNPELGERELDEMISEFWPVQPEPGSVADQLLKKGEERGIVIGEERGIVIGEERGEVRGEARGLAKGIRALQAILGIPQTAEEDLMAISADSLQCQLDSLQQQVSHRLG